MLRASPGAFAASGAVLAAASHWAPFRYSARGHRAGWVTRGAAWRRSRDPARDKANLWAPLRTTQPACRSDSCSQPAQTYSRMIFLSVIPTMDTTMCTPRRWDVSWRRSHEHGLAYVREIFLTCRNTLFTLHLVASELPPVTYGLHIAANL
jgi:hypothetical protein